MANRAYLYADDRPDAWDWSDERSYYDSRWSFPLAWFFLFGPGDVHAVDVEYGDSRWREARFSSEKASALARFQRRRSLLADVIEHRLGEEVVDLFVTKLGAWPGRYLLVDPSEVFQRDEEDVEAVGRILKILADPECEADVVREAVMPYVGAAELDPDRLECQILGWTYD